MRLSQQADASKYQTLVRFNLSLIILKVTEEISVYKSLPKVTLLFLVGQKQAKVWWQQNKRRRAMTHLRRIIIINATRHLKNKDWARTLFLKNMSLARISRIQSSNQWTRALSTLTLWTKRDNANQLLVLCICWSMVSWIYILLSENSRKFLT